MAPLYVPTDRLTAVPSRLCIDTDTDRPVQSALASVLKEVASIAPMTPIVIVGTKKDKFLRLHKLESSLEMAENSPVGSLLAEAELLLERQAMFKRQFENSKDTSSFWSRLDVKFAFVSKGKRPFAIRYFKLHRFQLLTL